MHETITLDQRGVRVRIRAHPVTRGDFRRFLEETGRPIPALLTRHGAPESPVTEVSQKSALEYCAWIGAREGRLYRLPAMSELAELAREAAEEGISREIWPHHGGTMTEVVGGLKQVWLCEWTMETESIARPDGARRVLGSVFYPPWLREGPNATHAQAYLSAEQGYSFITFRLACPL